MSTLPDSSSTAPSSTATRAHLHASAASDTAAVASEHIRRLPSSRIREVANAAMDDPDVLAFWFGEPDNVTDAAIREAAKQALDNGDTFYRHNLGIPPLRDALARYISGLHGPVDPGRVIVTSAGVNALMLAAQAILGPGDRVVAVVPLWPNVTAIPEILGAQVVRVGLRLDERSGRWTLDLERLLQAASPGTRAIIINSPNNPTGWTLGAADLRRLLEHCRRHGIWLLSDEAYERLIFDGSPCAPSVLDIAGPDDRVIVANTFSKTWQMTGWRLGWLVVPPALTPDLAKLIEFNTSCAPGFVQQAGLAALAMGEAPIRAFTETLRQRGRALIELLRPFEELQLGQPDGGMYLFFRHRRESDSLALATHLVREAGLGLAPGVAFGPEGQGFLRWCFARPQADLRRGVERLAAGLESRARG